MQISNSLCKDCDYTTCEVVYDLTEDSSLDKLSISVGTLEDT